MDEFEAGKFWDQNADTWTLLARSGYDGYRDHFNTPAFFDMLPVVVGQEGIDVGCGEGYNTRLLAKKSAIVTGIDISEKFISHAQMIEDAEPLGINYKVASATQLPFEAKRFAFATSFMCLMDIPNPEKALQEVYRILEPNGFFQFSITHPCFTTAHRKNLRRPDGMTYAIEIGNYFNGSEGKIEEWLFGNTPPEIKDKHSKFRVPIFHKTLTQWFDMILAAGFKIEKINEPLPDDQAVASFPFLQDAQVVSYFLHIRCRK